MSMPDESTDAQPAQSSRRRVWLEVRQGAGALIVVLIAAAVVVAIVMRISFEPSNPAYSGAPVEAWDAVPGAVVVGFDDRVAYSIDPRWQTPPPGTSASPLEGLGPNAQLIDMYLATDLLDGHFSSVVVFAFDAPGGSESLEQQLTFLVGAIAASMDGSATQEPAPIETPYGLMGYEAALAGQTDGIPVEGKVTAVANGRTSVIIQTTTFYAPADIAAHELVVTSLRVDPS
jgi:hypothetical protein